MVLPIYRYTARSVPARPPTPRQRPLAALAGNQEQMNRFAGSRLGRRVSEFFSPENMHSIMGLKPEMAAA
jgi:hypothetical protein